MIDDSQLVNSLLQQGFIDRATLKEGLERTRASGKPLYETLIFGRFVPEDKLVKLVGRLLNVPTVSVQPHKITNEVRDLVPASMARRNRVIPLELRDGTLVLGMVDPIDVLAMDEVATHTGIDIQPVLVGPSAIAEAIEDVYGVGQDGLDGGDGMSAFDFDVEGMMDEMMAGGQWSELFDDEDEPSTEDSAVLAREMRDRPSTDVLADEDVDAAVADADADAHAAADEEEEDLIEIEIIEELGRPSRPPEPYASLDKWEVDEAITKGKEGSSQILSAASAEEIFRAEPRSEARLEADEDDSTRPGLDDEEIPSEVLDTQTGKTTVGVGIDHLENGALGGDVRAGDEDLEDDTTGRTSMGIGVRIDDDDEEPDNEDTDYGALGRAILKSGPDTPSKKKSKRKTRESAEVAKAEEPPPKTKVREDRPTDPEPAEKRELRRNKVEEETVEDDGKTKGKKKRASQESPKTDVISRTSFDEDKKEARNDEAPDPEDEITWEGVDARVLVGALARLLIQKNVLTAEELNALVRELSEDG